MKTTTQQKPISKMGYMEIEDSLILCLNSKVTKQNVLRFTELLKGFNNPKFNNTILSIGYLKGLMIGKNNLKNVKIFRFLKKAEIKPILKNNYLKTFDNFGNGVKSKSCLKFVII